MKVDLIFYDPTANKLITIPDPYNHKPYCLTKYEYKSELTKITDSDSKFQVKSAWRTDPISDIFIPVLRISAPDPLSIGGSEDSIRNKIITWESDIKYYERYLYDKGLICGLWYEIYEKAGKISAYEDESINFSEVEKRLSFGQNEEYDEFVREWIRTLNQPVPHIKRVAIDIEVEFDGDKIPSVAAPHKKITAIGFSSNDGLRKVYTLDESKKYQNTDSIIYYSNERQMIIDSFKIFGLYPFIITFNGDAFDLPYLFARSERLKIPYKNVPLTVKSKKIENGAYTDPVYVKDAIHLDLYRFFKNPSIQNYAFSHKYAEYGLDSISKGLLNESKIVYEGSLNSLTPDKLGEYCLNDSDLTIKLTTFNDNLLIKLITMLCRISKMTVDDLTRYGANQWGKGMIFSEMIKRDILIPRPEELLAKGDVASQEATIKGKSFKGAYVHKPEKGVYFNVKVGDFASLYPSIIKENNVSFESIKCAHPSCQVNNIPETDGWKCGKKRGIVSYIIGSLRDLRVNYYKWMSKKEDLNKEEQQFYDIIAQTLKVVMNASYGILGFEAFPLFSIPAAEAVTAYGRSMITGTIKKAQEYDINILYGDSDSVMIHNALPEDINKLVSWTKQTFNIDLEIEKSYRYLILTNLKKNYLGITDKGKPDVKGLTGKKSHTPIFIRDLFFEVIDLLCDVMYEAEIPIVRNKITNLIKKRVEELKSNSIPFTKLAYNMVVNKDLHLYGKKLRVDRYMTLDNDEEQRKIVYNSLPQHIKAARMLPNIGAGSVISIIKTKDKDGVKPRQLVKSIDEVDIDKYIELMASTFGQLLDSFELDFKTIISGSKQLTFDEVFLNERGRLL